MIEQEILTDAANDQPDGRAAVEAVPTRSRILGAISGPIFGMTSLGFILLQSACVAVMTLSGLRLLIGIGSLAAASSTLKFLDTIHGAGFRLPMMAIAAAGSLVNLYVIWRVRSLRARAASAWRVRPPTQKQLRSETVQILFAIVTLILVAAELVGHAYLFGNSFS